MAASAGGLVRDRTDAPVTATVRRSGLTFSLRRNPRLVVGGGLVTLLVIAAVFAPLLTHFDPRVGDASDGSLAPSFAHWLGTDDQGRDVMSRVLFGARVSL